MKRALRPLLMGLVLANLAFVELTEAASPTWLLPLVSLTLLSPLLVRLRGFLAYRVVWNLAVIGVFALLVQHTSSAGVENLLSDGLLLAALCQVHLLNNIGPDQKPDLLLFNSFLIAAVTSFLSVDFLYSVTFLLYAPVLVLAMQVLVLSRVGGEAPPLAAVLRVGLPKAAAALAVTFAAFLLLPRDFHRAGFLSKYVDLRPVGSMLSVGFSPEVDLAKDGPAMEDTRVALRVRVLDGDPAAVPPHWRGALLTRFDGVHWQKDRGFPPPPRIERRRARVRVEPAAELRGRRFSPRNARVAQAGPAPVLDIGDIRPEVIGDPRPFLDLPDIPAAKAAADLAREALAGAGGRRPERATRLADWLRSHRMAVAPSAPGRARNLSEFLAGAAPGHCELFASALALMLRSQGLPCRLVTGFRATEWDESGAVLTVRNRDAHAWVEVHDPDAGWVTLDATPAASSVQEDSESLLSGAGALLTRLWRTITSFDDDARARVLASLAAAATGVAGHALRHPEVPACLAALAVALVLVRRRRLGAARPAAVRALLRAVRRAGLTFLPGETPRRVVARAEAVAVPEDRLTALRRAATAHERARYALPRP